MAVDQKNKIRRDTILGSKRLSNYFWSGILLSGGIGFFLAGLSSYLNTNLLPFASPNELIFLPQGIVMLFYGIVGLSLGTYLFLTILWDVGGGYNEFNKVDSLIRISRNGFPGKNRQIFLVYPITNIKSIKVRIQDGLNPKRIIYLCTKDLREIPLTPVQEPASLTVLEQEASDLAKFLEVPLEGV
jgi:hypothetical protein